MSPSRFGALFFSPFLLCAGFTLGCSSEPQEPQAEPQARPAARASPSPSAPPASPAASPAPQGLALADAKADEAKADFRAFVDLLEASAGDQELKVAARRATQSIRAAIDAYNEVLDPLRDDDGLLDAEHQEQEARLQELARDMLEVEKRSPR